MKGTWNTMSLYSSRVDLWVIDTHCQPLLLRTNSTAMYVKQMGGEANAVQHTTTRRRVVESVTNEQVNALL